MSTALFSIAGHRHGGEAAYADYHAIAVNIEDIMAAGLIAALQQESVDACGARAARDGVAILTDNIAVAADAEGRCAQRSLRINEAVIASLAAEKRMRHGETLSEGLADNFALGVDVPGIGSIGSYGDVLKCEWFHVAELIDPVGIRARAIKTHDLEHECLPDR